MGHLPTPESKDQLEAILERALTAYHRDERHGGAQWIDERVLDTELVPVTREAFRDVDDLPSDEEVLRTLENPLQLLGEGYHVIALIEPRHRFVVKYAKHPTPVPPLAPPKPASREAWQREHGARADGSLHPAIWQHIRAFEAYGPLAVPSRTYIADDTLVSLSMTSGGRWNGSARSASCARWGARRVSFRSTTLTTSRTTNARPKR
jgi:hypothetical protein